MTGDFAFTGEVECSADAEVFAGGVVIGPGRLAFGGKRTDVPSGEPGGPGAGNCLTDALVFAGSAKAFAAAAHMEAPGSKDDVLFAAIERVAIEVNSDEGGGDGAHDQRVELGFLATDGAAEVTVAEGPVVSADAGKVVDVDAEVCAAGRRHEGGVAFDDGFGVALEVAGVEEGVGAEQLERGGVIGESSFDFGIEGTEAETAFTGKIEIGVPAIRVGRGDSFEWGGFATSGTVSGASHGIIPFREDGCFIPREWVSTVAVEEWGRSATFLSPGHQSRMGGMRQHREAGDAGAVSH